MVSYLFDTNAFIHLMQLDEPRVTRVKATGPSSIAVCSIASGELWHGAAPGRYPQPNGAEQDAVLAPFRVLDFDAAAADRYAAMRAQLACRGQPVRDRALMTAAIALAHGMTVVTGNTHEFMHLPGLKVEDWMRG
jgi:tRNA(fMet)-specific endonuclease VapC